MGLPEWEVGQLTLREYDALLKRKVECDNRVQFNAGIIAAAVYNAAPFGDGKRKALSPLDFVPQWSDRIKNEEDDLTKMTPEEQRDYLIREFEKTGRLVRMNKDARPTPS